MKNAQEIIEIIKEELHGSDLRWEMDSYGLKPDEDASEYHKEGYQRIRELFESDVEVVHEDRIGIDKDTKVIVWHFKDPDVYIKITGWYSSWEGSELDVDTLTQVVPQTKTVTVYEELDEDQENETLNYDPSYDSY